MKYNFISIAISITLAIILLINPFLPYLEYFAFKDYIIKNLCENKNKPELKCNGKCYLKKMITENHNIIKFKDNIPIKLNNNNIDYYLLKNKIIIICNKLHKELYLLSENYKFLETKGIFRPPQKIIACL